MLDAFNAHMSSIFKPSFITCLDESMSIRFNKWTCPGWMFVPRKPHPFGNEYHTICCGLSGILFSLDLVEGKDRPKEYGKYPSKRFDKTYGLLLRSCKTLFNTGKIVVLDSGFCVLKGLVELKKEVYLHMVL